MLVEICRIIILNNHFKIHPQEFSLKNNKIKKTKINQIQRINTFLEDYKLLNPYLKNLLKRNYQYYQNELLKEYHKVSKHPYLNEYLESPK